MLINDTDGLLVLPKEEPKIALPDYGGLHYESENFSIDFHPSAPEYYFIAPCDIIAFYLGPSTPKVAAHNSDLVRKMFLPHNSIAFVPKGSELYGMANQSNMEMIALNFEPSMRLSIEKEIPGPRISPEMINNTIFTAEEETLKNLAYQFMSNGFQGGKLVAESIITLSISLIIDRLRRKKLPDVIAPLSEQKVGQALEFMSENHSHDIGLQQIAEAVAVSSYHFSRSFKAATGKSPYAYLVEIRVEKAKQYLAGGSARITDIAINCGFGSTSHFTSTFKRLTGITPTQYRSESLK